MASVYDIYPTRHNVKGKYAFFRDTLISRHPAWKEIYAQIGELEYEVPVWRSLDDAVLYAVVGQMLSIAAAKSIIHKLLKRFGDSTSVIQWAVKSCKRKGAACGLSQSKRKALAGWAEFCSRLQNSDGGLERGCRRNLSGRWRRVLLDEYRREITQIWGFGDWAADMIAIFHLGRMDVWPENDLGLKKAAWLLFKKRSAAGMKKIVAGCETVAAIYLWEWMAIKAQEHKSTRIQEDKNDGS